MSDQQQPQRPIFTTDPALMGTYSRPDVDTFDGTPASPDDAPDASPAPVCETPPGAFLMSLNGFDEIAIANHFGARIGDLREDPVTGGRALAFVHQRRLGLPDKDAYAASMNLTMQQVVDYFAPEPKTDDASAEGNAPGGYV